MQKFALIHTSLNLENHHADEGIVIAVVSKFDIDQISLLIKVLFLFNFKQHFKRLLSLILVNKWFITKRLTTLWPNIKRWRLANTRKLLEFISVCSTFYILP